ncbi:alpha/beta fold hydrolase [Streptomyces fuscigenes]|uniref:alpha/beta fold hydrolase n=1 Tax=Streptomyces fuscigenes TaxID=1528880 RepID=UPI001F48B0F6|nr:alpha/beta hydrolase [Streptomyces fuscigenes]MCF3963089.1 alpha/beta hydrolase [Streptomyces fuscigenes]
MFVLIPGAGGAAWYWHRVLPELRAAGHEAVAVDLPGPDGSAGLSAYADAVAAAAGDGGNVVLVAQSMGGFTAPMACSRMPVALLVLVNAMIPLPGETAGDWWDATGWSEARTAAAEAGGYPAAFDLDTYFLHDVPPALAAESGRHERAEAEAAFAEPCAIERWPEVPTRVVAARDDRFFPAEFQRRVARERLGLPVDEVPGGHLAALSRPVELAQALVAYADASV